MSLKNFHIFFITVSFLTAFGFTVWTVNEYATEGGGGTLLLGILSLLVAIGLVVYGRAFRRKIRELPHSR